MHQRIKTSKENTSIGNSLFLFIIISMIFIDIWLGVEFYKYLRHQSLQGKHDTQIAAHSAGNPVK